MVLQAIDRRLRVVEEEHDAVKTRVLGELGEHGRAISEIRGLVINLTNLLLERAAKAPAPKARNSSHAIVAQVHARKEATLDEVADRLTTMNNKGDIKRLLSELLDEWWYGVFLSVRKNITRLFWPAAGAVAVAAGHLAWQIVKDHWR